ncbi:fimbrillin family protein [uncultured Duncaniella sp.]|uniref:fimbrillin family protein n=1 Tax=uncultured Duncaniella sp. TaxID=2768039 RepID=UPI0025A95D8E|nr:fimbrillin family protein [uncultured Duncaniella sp.]
MNTKLSFLGAAVLLLTSACSEDSVELVNNGSEITFNTSISRAMNLNQSNLESFKVWAFSDITDSAPFIKDEIVTKKGNNSYFSFDHSIFWPSDVETLKFWAIAPVSTPNIKQDGGKKLTIQNYTPKQNPLEQEDLIVANATAQKSEGTSINLQFRHALSQIVVRASEGTDTDHSKNIQIKGAWIVNPAASGTLSTNDAATELNWAASSTTKSYYGMEFSNVKTLSHTYSSIFDFDPKKDNIKNPQTNLLLIPQQLTAWAGTQDEQNLNKGAYILFLCRVEAIHDGELHEGGSDPAIKSEDGKHIHQLFPDTKTFDEAQYGYTCVPIGTKWEPGKRYIYNLSFCGATSGAGIYPPEDILAKMPDGNGKYIKTRPVGEDGKEEKKVGDPVLDDPIRFTVTVNDWLDAGGSTDGWTEGNIGMN